MLIGSTGKPWLDLALAIGGVVAILMSIVLGLIDRKAEKEVESKSTIEEQKEEEEETQAAQKERTAKKHVLKFFHHVHCDSLGHEVEHGKGDTKHGFYTIKHCMCRKHSISNETAIGYDHEDRMAVFDFSESCPFGGYHIESGIENKDKTFMLAGEIYDLAHP
jgi:mannitol-specific phosphotransferase system IIBC component